MAKIVIPDYAVDFLPKNVDPSQLWVHHNPKADSLTVYFTGKPVPSVWNDVDQYTEKVIQTLYHADHVPDPSKWTFTLEEHIEG